MPLPRITRSSLLSRVRILRSSALPIPEVVRAWKRPIIIFAKCALVFHLTASYVGSISSTQGISMVPTIPHSYRFIRPKILISALHRRGHNIKVGDVVTYVHPIIPGSFGCKRVIGMPGDFVSIVTPGRKEGDLEKEDADGEFASVREEVIQVPEGHCWLAGDNLEWSRDSRLFGPVPLGLIRGKVLAVVWPWSDAKWLGADRDMVDVKDEEREWVVI